MKTMHFSVDGEGFTDLVRNIWNEGNPYKAFEIVSSGLGMNEGLFLQLIGGKKKLINDESDPSVLLLEDDNGCKTASIETVTDLIEKEYKKIFSKLSALKRTYSLYCGDFDETGDVIALGLPTAAAGYYRKKESKFEKMRISELEKKLDNVGIQLEFIYKLQNKPIITFINSLPAATSFSDIENKEISKSFEPYSSTNGAVYAETIKKEMNGTSDEDGLTDDRRKHEESLKLKEVFDAFQEKVADFNARMADESLRMMSDGNLIELDDLERTARNINGLKKSYRNLELNVGTIHPQFVNPTTPDMAHAYILPNGRLYPVSLMGHSSLEDDLQDLGLIPIEGRDSFGSVNWTKLGWIKISSEEIIVLNPPFHGNNSDCFLNEREYYKRPEVQWRTLKMYLDSRDWEVFRSSWKSFNDPQSLYKALRADENTWFDKHK